MSLTTQNPSLPERRTISGKFCIPEPSALSGTFTTSAITLSITSITRSSSVATATVAAGHNMSTGQFVTISGANQYEYNGIKKVTVTGLTTFTFFVDSGAVTPATGTLVGSNITGKNGCMALGVATKAMSEFAPGDFIYVASLNAARQVKIIHDDLNWEFYDNFPSTVTAKPVLQVKKSPVYNAASFQNASESDAGVLQEDTFVGLAVESFANPVGLGPICGDTQSATYNASLQRLLPA